MDSNLCLIFQLSLIFITILQTEGVNNDEYFLLSPKPRNYQGDYPCMTGADMKNNSTCCTCPGSCGQTYPREVTRTYSKGIRVLRLYFSIRHQNRTKTDNNTDIRLYICPRNSTNDIIVQNCLLKNPLRIIHKSRTSRSIRLDVEIPPNLTCRHCLIQWSITKDKSPNSTFLGKQYFGCSDIAILSLNDIELHDILEPGSGTGNSQTTSLPTSITSSQPAFQTSYGTTTPHSNTASPCWAVGEYARISGVKEWCIINCMRGYCPATHCKCASRSPSTTEGTTITQRPKTSPVITTILPTTVSICRAVGLYANTHGMDEWCTNNCMRGYCPATHCKCASRGPSTTEGTTITQRPKTSPKITTILPTTVSICRAVGLYANTHGMDEWCTNNCRRGYCPETHCKCVSNSKASHGPSTTEGTTITQRPKTSPEITTILPTTVSICRAVGLYANTHGMDEWCTNNCRRGYCPETHCKCDSNSKASHGPSTTEGTTITQRPKTSPEITTILPTTVSICRAVGLYANTHGMNEWCTNNCKRGYCPETHCKCTSEQITTVPTPHKLTCRGSGPFAGNRGMDQWCENNCLKGYCPASHCKCISGIHTVTELPIPLRSRLTTQMKPFCRAVGIMATVKGMHKWCMMNCVNGYCPASHCKCSSGMYTTGSDQTSYTTISSQQVNPTIKPKTWSIKPLINTTTPQPSDIVTKLPNTHTTHTHDIETKRIPLSTLSPEKVTSSSTSSGKLPTTVSPRKETHRLPPLSLGNLVAGTTNRDSTMTSTNAWIFAKTKIDQASMITNEIVPASTVASSTAQVTTCTATGAFAGIDGMDNWCNINCNSGYCPESQCKCDTLTTTATITCKAKQPYAQSPGMDKWCITNCAVGYCPSSHCQC